MDSMEANKAIASVLVGGIAFFLCGLVSSGLVHPERLQHAVIKIEGVGAAPAAAAAPAEKEEPIAVFLAKADPKEGQQIADRVCGVCHTFNEGGRAGVGPNLYDVVGGPHAHMKGYSYSEAMEKHPGKWTYDELNEWLTKPSAFIPGTKMSFPGFHSEKERAEVIDYLRTLSPHPLPLPPVPAAPAAAAPAKPAAAPAKPAAPASK